MGSIMCKVALMFLFNTSFIPTVILFFNALATFKISLSVIFLLISLLSGAYTSSVGTVTVFLLTSGLFRSLKMYKSSRVADASCLLLSSFKIGQNSFGSDF